MQSVRPENPRAVGGPLSDPAQPKATVTAVDAGVSTSGLRTLRDALASHQALEAQGPTVAAATIASPGTVSAAVDHPIDTQGWAGQKPLATGFSQLVEELLALPTPPVSCLCLVGFVDPGLVAATAATLALNLAQRDRNVLLIDGDLTFGALSRRAGQTGRSGMIEILNESALWRRSLYATSCVALTFLPVGRGVLSCAVDEVGRWDSLLQNVRLRFDTVVVSGGIWDAHSIAVCRACDRTLPVVELGTTPCAPTERGVAELKAAAVTTAGCIVFG